MTKHDATAVLALLSTLFSSGCRCASDSTGTGSIPAMSVASSTSAESSASAPSSPEAGLEEEPDASRVQDADADASDAETGPAVLKKNDPLRLLGCCPVIAQGSSRPPGDALKLVTAYKDCIAAAQRGNREGVDAALRSVGLKSCRQ